MASDFHIRLAAHHVRHGGVIVYPTETVYGLGCDPFNEPAVDYLNFLKQRTPEKGLILLAGSLQQLELCIDIPDDPCRAKILSNEQPTSWIVAAKNNLPSWITAKNGSVAVRISKHPVVTQLCSLLGFPLVSSSANPGGGKPAENMLQIQNYFHNQVHTILTSNIPASGTPSTLKHLTNNKIFRP